MKKYFTLLAVASVFTMANAQEEIAGVKYDDGIAKKWELKVDGSYTNDFRNLPNDDKLSLTIGGGRRNVYHRQIRLITSEDSRKKLQERFVELWIKHKELIKAFNKK